MAPSVDSERRLRPYRGKRLCDLVVLSVVAVPVALLASVCAVAVRLTSRGPVLFRQTRIGRRAQHRFDIGNSGRLTARTYDVQHFLLNVYGQHASGGCAAATAGSSSTRQTNPMPTLISRLDLIVPSVVPKCNGPTRLRSPMLSIERQGIVSREV